MSDQEQMEQDVENVEAEPKEKGLGRGLAALFGDDDEEDIYSYIAEGNEDAGYDEGDMSYRMMPIEWIKPCATQPRRNFDADALKELSESISAHGIIQPILVRPMPEEENAYEIIAGERRWRASQMAQLHQIPVTIQYLTDSDMMELALIENLQRENLTAIEEADGYQHLMEIYGHTQEKLAASLGKSRSHIANMLRLLNLPDSVKKNVNEGKLSAGHARSLVGVNNAEELAHQIIEQNLSVRDAERLKSDMKKDKGPSATKGQDKTTTVTTTTQQATQGSENKNVDILALEKELAQLLGLTVDINSKGQGGQLVIHYQNLEQMDDILHRLSHNPGRIIVNG